MLNTAFHLSDIFSRMREDVSGRGEDLDTNNNEKGSSSSSLGGDYLFDLDVGEHEEQQVAHQRYSVSAKSYGEQF